jgi:Serine/threonine protein kinase
MNISSEVQTTASSSTEMPFRIIDKLGNSRAIVYLVFSEKTKKHHALKLFNYEDGKMSQSYLNEARFVSLSHPNVISYQQVQPLQKASYRGTLFNSSYILMELAPYGNFADLIKDVNFFRNEKIVRTYFHQLIAGLEYLHSNGVAHLDLKLDNLLLGEGYKLKISDFDSAYRKKDPQIISRGTKNFRAPEIKAERCTDPMAADIYAAGIVLFIMQTSSFPYIEDSLIQGNDMQELLRTEDSLFWDIHADVLGDSKLSPEFKSLFMSMVKEDVFERATIEEIKSSAWYRGPVFSDKELKIIVSQVLASQSN